MERLNMVCSTFSWWTTCVERFIVPRCHTSNADVSCVDTSEAASMDLVQGTLDVLVLRGLTWGPKHGYAVARWIEQSSNGKLTVLDGALYTALHRMEERGWIAAEWGISGHGRRAKFYRLTPV